MKAPPARALSSLSYVELTFRYKKAIFIAHYSSNKLTQLDFRQLEELRVCIDSASRLRIFSEESLPRAGRTRVSGFRFARAGGRQSKGNTVRSASWDGKKSMKDF
jgi:hypothetical protein